MTRRGLDITEAEVVRTDGLGENNLKPTKGPSKRALKLGDFAGGRIHRSTEQVGDAILDHVARLVGLPPRV